MPDIIETTVTASNGDPLAVSFHPAGELPTPAVVVCHGMESHRRGKVAVIAAALCEAGIHAVRFDHGGCGDSGGDHQPIDVQRRLAELRAVAAWLGQRPEFDGTLGLAGSSMGAAVSLMGAAALGARAWSGIATPVSFWPAVRAASEAYAGRSLVIWGDRDEVVPPADSEALLARWTGRSEACRIPGGDHRLAAHVPDIAARMVAFFASQLR